MKRISLCALAAALVLGACGNHDKSGHSALLEKLVAVTDFVPGTVGIAFVSATDTITVNNGVRYPMMSVFKLHQALAVSDFVEHNFTTLDSVITVTSDEIDTSTWSPMLKKYPSEGFDISIGELMDYALTQSDNNASNILFERCMSPFLTDAFVKMLAADGSFQIRFSEAEMKISHSRSLANYTSPLSAALLIRQLFTERLVSKDNQEAIKDALTKVATGHDRLGAIIEANDSLNNSPILFAHKTGSGYRNVAGELMAHNDVGYFRLPDGRDYALAVFIRNFSGTEAEASAVIARISQIVFDYMRD